MLFFCTFENAYNAAKDIGPLLTGVAALVVSYTSYKLERKSHKISSMEAWQQHREKIIDYSDQVIHVLSDLIGLCDADPVILEQEFWDRKNRLVYRLSALIDCGRMFIPNIMHDANNREQIGAYEGSRDKALDCLVAAFKMGSAIDSEQYANNRSCRPFDFGAAIGIQNPQLVRLATALKKLPDQRYVDNRPPHYWSCKESLVEAKRQFVSEVQNLVNTRKWNSEIDKLLPSI